MAAAVIDDALLGLYLSSRAPEPLVARVQDAVPIIPSAWLFRLCRVLVRDPGNGAIDQVVRAELDAPALGRLMAILADPPTYLIQVRNFGANALRCAELSVEYSLSLASAEALLVAIEAEARLVLHSTQNEPKIVDAAAQEGVELEFVEVA